MPPTKTPLDRFQTLFRGRENVYGQWVKDNVITHSKPVTEAHWKKHLNGEGPFLGIVPVRLDNTCYWGAIDIDDDATNHATLADLVRAAGLPLVTVRSKSGGAHLYLFLSEPVPAELVKSKLTQWAAALGYTRNHDGRPIEIFPKNAKLKPGDQGNWINLPYYGVKTTNRYGVDDSGAKMSFERFLDVAEANRISEISLSNLNPAINGGFSDGPPCLQTLDQLGYPDGSRNMGLYNVGIYFKLAKPDSWQQEVAKYNKEKMDPPLKDRDVKAIVRSLEMKDYVYKCDDLPIHPHCQKSQCKKQAFGIEVFRKQAKMKAMPSITNLRKILTDPPRWIVTVNEKDIDLDTDQLMALTAFRKAVLERCNVIVPMLKIMEWDDVLGALLTTKVEIPAPEDAGVLGQFVTYLQEFVMRRFHASTVDDIVAGMPFEEVGSNKVLFRAADLTAFLERKKFRDFDTAKLFSVLRNMGAGYTVIHVKKVPVQVWSLPIPENEHKVPLEPPKRKGKSF